MARTPLITEEQKAEIKAKYAAGGVTMFDLSDEYGVSHSYIRKIIHNLKTVHKPKGEKYISSIFCEKDIDRWKDVTAKFSNVEWVKIKTDGARDLLEELACK